MTSGKGIQGLTQWPLMICLLDGYAVLLLWEVFNADVCHVIDCQSPHSS